MNRLAAVALINFFLVANLAWAAPASFSYGGRLTQGDQAVEGPVDLELRFYRSGNRIATAAFNAVKLVDGVFQVEVTPAQVGNTLDGAEDVLVEVFDKTSNISYPQQRLVSMPFAIYANKVPVDESTLSFGSDGKLKVVNPFTSSVTSVTAGTGLSGGGTSGAVSLSVNVGTTAGKIVQLDSSAKLPAVDGSALSNLNASKLQGQTVSPTAPTTAGQVLKWNGSAWAPGTDDGGVAGAISSGTNLGTSSAGSADVFDTVASSSMKFRRLKEGTGVDLTQNTDDVTIAVATGGVGTNELANNAVGTAKLSNDAVTSDKIANSTITNDDISNGAAITDSKLATITTVGKVSGNAITAGTLGGSSGFAGTGGVSLQSAGSTGSDLRFFSNNNTNYLGFKAPNGVTTNTTWTLPTGDGANAQVLTTNGLGELRWSTPSGAGDMLKSVYDIGNDGKVDDAEKLNGQPASYYTSAANLNGTVDFARLPVGNSANTVAAGNDARLSDARTPTGAAGGDLVGSYPNPSLKSSTTADADRAVGTDHIKDSAVTNAKLAGSIAPAKIATDSSNRFVSDTDKTAWNNAVSWGNHATAGYLSSASLATPAAIGSTTPAAGTFTNLQANTALKLKDNDGTANYVSLRAASTMSTDVSYTLPATADAGKYLTTDASGVLTWGTPSGSGDMMKNQNLSDLTDKPAARSNLGLGSLATLSAIGSSQITDESIVNTDIASSAGIATSKLSGPVTSIAGNGLGSLATLNTVSTNEITDGTITNTDIGATAAIADTKLATISTAGKVSGGAITTGTITGNTAINTTGTISSGAITSSGTVSTSGLTTSAQAAVVMLPYNTAAGATGEMQMRELSANGTQYVGFKAPDNIANSLIWTLPSAAGAAGQVLTTSANGDLSWTTPSGGEGPWTTSGNNINYSGIGNVGIGTISPNSKLVVNGSARNLEAFQNTPTGSGGTTNILVDFSRSNLQFFNGTSDCTNNITASNLLNGGSYTLVVKGNQSSTCSNVTITITISSSGSTFRSMAGPDAGQTSFTTIIATPKRHTIFGFMVIGTDVYVTSSPGY